MQKLFCEVLQDPYQLTHMQLRKQTETPKFCHGKMNNWICFRNLHCAMALASCITLTHCLQSANTMLLCSWTDQAFERSFFTNSKLVFCMKPSLMWHLQELYALVAWSRSQTASPCRKTMSPGLLLVGRTRCLLYGFNMWIQRQAGYRRLLGCCNFAGFELFLRLSTVEPSWIQCTVFLCVLASWVVTPSKNTRYRDAWSWC